MLLQKQLFLVFIEKFFLLLRSEAVKEVAAESFVDNKFKMFAFTHELTSICDKLLWEWKKNSTTERGEIVFWFNMQQAIGSETKVSVYDFLII